MTYSEESHIDYIIDRFDFEIVKDYMDMKNWKWVNSVPTLSELKSTSLDLLMRVKDGDFGDFTSTGGFTATNCGDYLKLDFSISDIDSIYLNLNENYENDKKKKERKEKLEVINEVST